jgi:CRP-like cAMP-binding protein
MLKPVFAKNGAYIYQEKDSVKDIFFLIKGKAAFMIPEYDELVYIVINEGDMFGIIDLVPTKNEVAIQNNCKRKFTVKAIDDSEIMALSIKVSKITKIIGPRRNLAR